MFYYERALNVGLRLFLNEKKEKVLCIKNLLLR